MEPRDKNGLTEAEFLAAYAQKAARYPRPFLTADCVIFAPGEAKGERRVLLIRRGGHPYLGCLALPGGFAQSGETLLQSALRELVEETGVSDAPVRLLGVYSDPGRDPRGWVVSAAYLADLPEMPCAVASDDAADVVWARASLTEQGALLLQTDRETLSLLPPDYRQDGLAFDHGRIIAEGFAACPANKNLVLPQAKHIE